MARNLEAREHGGYNHVIPILARRLLGDYLALLYQNTVAGGDMHVMRSLFVSVMFPLLCHEGVDILRLEILTMPSP